MESLVCMKGRNKAFKGDKFKEVTIKDSRFGLRRMHLNEKEKPSVFTYQNPGRGAQGESSN
jgi:hypothetical protein